MIVLVNGLPLFSRRLVDDLRSVDRSNKYFFLDTYNSAFDRFLFLLLVPFSSVVISMNGVTDNSGSLNWVIRWKKKLILQWMGSDTLMAMDRYQKGTIHRKYIDYAHNFVDSFWLQEELLSIELEPKMVRFKYGELHADVVQRYAQLSVVSYVGNNNQEFYGIREIAALARQFPEIIFHLYGIDASIVPITENVKCYGWQPGEVFQKALKENPVYLRLTEHDGFSVTVIEALAYGAEVIWSLPSERTYLAKSLDDAAGILQEVFEKVKRNNMQPNQENIRFVKEVYNKQKIMSNYVKVLHEL